MKSNNLEVGDNEVLMEGKRASMLEGVESIVDGNNEKLVSYIL
jgi:hypothetical protein